MPLRPSVIKGLENILGSKKVSSFVSETDSLYLEDNCGRIKINSNCSFNISEYVTGIIAGLKYKHFYLGVIWTKGTLLL
jgi:hypothetical protein